LDALVSWLTMEPPELLRRLFVATMIAGTVMNASAHTIAAMMLAEPLPLWLLKLPLWLWVPAALGTFTLLPL
jgi:hypothetical protein